MLLPPAVNGIGNAGGFKMQVEDRSGTATPQQFQAATQHLIDAAHSRPELSRLFTTFRASVPQLYANVDRVKAKKQNVAVTDVFTGAAGLPGRVLHQRLQLSRPHLARDGAGRCPVPRHRAQSPSSRRAISRARWCRWARYRAEGHHRPGPHPALRPVHLGRNQRRRRTGYSSGQAIAAMEEVADAGCPGSTATNGPIWPIRRRPQAAWRSSSFRSACCSSG